MRIVSHRAPRRNAMLSGTRLRGAVRRRCRFGGQVQDGGAVLGFSFYDIMSRIKVFGSDNAWQRLMAIREWDEEVQKYGGYRKYYNDGKGGTTLQGGGTAGGGRHRL